MRCIKCFKPTAVDLIKILDAPTTLTVTNVVPVAIKEDKVEIHMEMDVHPISTEILNVIIVIKKDIMLATVFKSNVMKLTSSCITCNNNLHIRMQ